MPRLRRVGVRRRTDFISDAWTEYLRSRCDRIDALVHSDMQLDSDFVADDSHRMEITRQAWEFRRDDILDQWIAERPGTRPPCWWYFDSPGLRRKVGGGGTLDPRPGAAILNSPPPGCGERLFLKYQEPVPAYETEREFLERHGLLTEAELQRLSR